MLRQRQSGRVVQRHHAAVRHHAVNELQFRRLERDGAVTVVQLGAHLGGQLPNHRVEDVVLMNGHHPQPPAGAAEMLREGIDADRVPGQLGHRRAEAGHERAIDVVGDEDEIAALFVHQIHQPPHGAGAHGVGRRIARVHEKERLHALVGELIHFRVRILPGVGVVRPALDAGVHVHDLEGEPIHVWNLDIGREGRNRQGNRVAAMQESVLHERVEDVAHRRRAPFHGEQVELPFRWPAIAHFLGEEFMHDALAAAEHPVRHGIRIADDALGQFVGEGLRIELELVDAPVPGVGQQLDAGGLRIRFKKFLKAPRETGSLRNLTSEIEDVDPAAGLFEAEAQEGSKGVARRGAKPVRVAAAGVEELGRAVARGHLGEFDQFIFQFKRTEFQ